MIESQKDGWKIPKIARAILALGMGTSEVPWSLQEQSGLLA